MRKLFLILMTVFPLILVAWIYWPGLKGNFNLEDAMFLGDAAKSLTSGNLKYVFVPWMQDYVRFFRQPVFVILYWLFKYNSFPYFVFCLAFHLLNVFLVYILAEKLINFSLISFFSSLIYGIYQINFEGLVWISAGTKDVPMVTFFLLCLLTFIYYLENNEKNFLFLSYCFFSLAFLCEFKAFLIPLVLISYEIIFKKIYKFNWIKKYLFFFLMELIFFAGVYKGTVGIFSGIKNLNSLFTFPASLPFYFLPIYRIFWVKVFTNAWGFSQGHSDELFLVEMGLVILIFLFALSVYLKLKNEKRKFSVILFLLIGTFLNYLPIIMMVFSGYYKLWDAVTMHWRYFSLAASLASIMAVCFIFWFNEEIILFVSRLLKTPKIIPGFLVEVPIFPVIFVGILLVFHLQIDRFMLSEFLRWSMPAKTALLEIKKTYPVFPKESVLVIEGTEDEEKYLYFQNRYLFENIFALYAEPNNSNYLYEQRNLPFSPDEGPYRTLPRLLYYTNLKDFLIGNHEHLYEPGEKINWISLNLPWRLPAYDRLFLGAIYGFYNPEKIYVFSFDEKGVINDITVSRRKEIRLFLSYFCFEKGIKTCSFKSPSIINDPGVKNSFINLSAKGQEIFKFLLTAKETNLPEIYSLKIN